jgi:hypothetical protein
MVSCFMSLDPKQTFSLKVAQTYIIQLRLSLQAATLAPVDPGNGSRLSRFRRNGSEFEAFLCE